MKFNSEKSAILKELLIAQEIIATKTSVSILSNVLLIAKDAKLTIKATDVKVNFEAVIPVDVEEEGKTTVFCSKLVSIINSLPDGEIEILEKNQKLHINSISKKVKFQLNTISDTDFPSFIEPEDSISIEIPAIELKKMITNTIFAVSEDQARYFMNGICMHISQGNMLFVATDGRRLSYIKKQFNLNESYENEIIIPTKILNVIHKKLTENGNVSIYLNEKYIFFNFANYKFSSPLIEGKFPNYEKVIPEKQEFSFEVNRKEFLEALKRVSLLVEKEFNRVYLEISSGKLVISSNEKEIGAVNEEIPCNFVGNNTVFALNYSYLEDPIKVMESDDVKIQFNDTEHAMTILSLPEQDFFHIVMPMRKEE
ncbi:MAG: DNA polymerase III subunit beta [Spirochaetaceae bacterium]|nr:DNA polymerase III subunit beta [Spirochaetaceae bacterium]